MIAISCPCLPCFIVQSFTSPVIFGGAFFSPDTSVTAYVSKLCRTTFETLTRKATTNCIIATHSCAEHRQRMQELKNPVNCLCNPFMLNHYQVGLLQAGPYQTHLEIFSCCSFLPLVVRGYALLTAIRSSTYAIPGSLQKQILNISLVLISY